jgi:hypothetical protein
MEPNIVVKERKYKRSEEYEEDEEFAKVFNTTTFEFEENEEFDKMFNTTTFESSKNEEDKEVDRLFNMNRNSDEEHTTSYEYEEDVEFAKVLYTTTFEFEATDDPNDEPAKITPMHEEEVPEVTTDAEETIEDYVQWKEDKSLTTGSVCP